MHGTKKNILLGGSETCALLSCYAASSGNFLPTFRANKNLRTLIWFLMLIPIGCPETSVVNYHCSLSNNPEERRSQLLRGGSPKSRKILCLNADAAFWQRPCL